MMSCILQVKKLSNSFDLPLLNYATNGSSGLDLYAANYADIVIEIGKIQIIPIGIAISIPDGFEGQIRPRSGLALNYGITVLNSPGTIDSDYRGEINIILINHGDKKFIVKRGMRIAQMVIASYAKVDIIEVQVYNNNDTIRGDKGFGSTGF